MDLVLKEAGLPAASPTANGAANGASDRVALAHQHASIKFPIILRHRWFLGILHKNQRLSLRVSYGLAFSRHGFEVFENDPVCPRSGGQC